MARSAHEASKQTSKQNIFTSQQHVIALLDTNFRPFLSLLMGPTDKTLSNNFSLVSRDDQCDQIC